MCNQEREAQYVAETNARKLAESLAAQMQAQAKYCARSYGGSIHPMGPLPDAGCNQQVGAGCLVAPSGLVARAAIEARIQELRNDADGLEALLDALPAKLPPMADEVLRSLITRWGVSLR